MPLVKRSRPQIGDVIEIPTPSGLAYFQFTHKHQMYGALIRILPGLFKVRPTDFSEVVRHKEKFVTFFPLGAACNRKIVHIVANEDVPAWALPFPLFRSGTRGADGTVKVWWLWDGNREWKIGSLKTEQQSLPIRGVWNDTLLIERIVSGWKPELNI